MPENTFDYVIVGGGTAGCAVAARLSEDPDVRVLPRRGRPVRRRRRRHPRPQPVDGAARVGLRLGLPHRAAGVRQLVDASRPGEGARRVLVAQLRDRVLGAPGEPRRLGRPGLRGLDRRRVLPLLQEARDRAGRRGARRRSRSRHRRPGHDPHRGRPGPCGEALLEACEQVGLPTTPLNTGRTVVRGANWFQVNARPDGTRSSASTSYIHPIMDSRPNLEVWTGYRAERLTFDTSGERPRATGVVLRTPDQRRVDRGRRDPRDDPVLGRDRRPEAPDALGHRAGRAPPRGRYRGPRRRARSGGEPPGPPGGPRAVGGPAGDADGVHAVVADRDLRRLRGPRRPPT